VFLSRLSFHTLPGKTDEVEGKLMKLLQWVEEAGGSKPRIMRTHFGSIGAPDLLFEQEAEDLGALETQIQKVTANGDFSFVVTASVGAFTAGVQTRAVQNYGSRN